MKLFTLIVSIGLLPLLCGQAGAQIRLSGMVTDKRSGTGISRATVLVTASGSPTTEGAVTGTDGSFTIVSARRPPLTLVFSAVGYRSDTIRVSNNSRLHVELESSTVTGQEIVVAASRVPENILSSPVSIEHIGLQAIRQAPAANFYDLIGHVKGVDMVTSGLLFSTPTTRGFGGSGNTGLIQLVDGMDNQAPGLNFSVSNVVGLSELDVANIELLPGASSALYGAGGTNGTLLFTSKDPFEYQGLSAEVKEGVMHVNDPQHKATPYQQYAVRYAQAFHDKVAFKINVSYIKAYDWIASDYQDYDKTHFRVKQGGNRTTDPAYDGVNVYGDETSANLHDIGLAMAAAHAIPSAAVALFPDQVVTRTGYNEMDLVDYNTSNLKLGGTLAWKITPSLRATLEGHWGEGTTVYTGADRYSLKDFHIGQYKLQLDGKHFMLRAYTTRENSGDAYNATALGQLMNEAWKPSYDPANPYGSWYIQYAAAFLTLKSTGATDAAAEQQARASADYGMPAPGSAQFKRIKDSVSRMAIPNGALFQDRSSMDHFEGLYNFQGIIPFVDLQAGGSYRLYRLNSGGTIFDDLDKKITIGQWGAFAQATKKLQRLKLTSAIRYDKTENFAGKWTPRIAAVYTVAPDNNIRVSYQTGYQLPTNQDQYIDLAIQQGKLIGSLPQFVSRYHLDDNPGFLVTDVEAYRDDYAKEYQANLQAGQTSDEAAYHAAVSSEGTLKDAAGGYRLYHFRRLQPETVHSLEVGYRGLLGEKKKLAVDAYMYACNYTNMIVSIFLVQPPHGPQPIAGSGDPAPYYGPQLIGDSARHYQTRVNSTGVIKTWGWALGGEYELPEDFRLSANVSYNKLLHVPEGVFAQFNTPAYRVNAGIGNTNVWKGLGFRIDWRYQTGYRYEGSFAIGDIPAFSTLDAEIHYRIPRYKLLLKLGGTDILNHYYRNAFGNPMIGGLYYVEVAYNVF